MSSWILPSRSGPAVTVGGFASKQLARDHARKHFLDPREHWEQIDEAARGLRQEAARVAEASGNPSPAYFEFLDSAARRYVDAVRTETETPLRVEPVEHRDERNRIVARIVVVTRGGVYAAFSGTPRNGVSDLRTALRRYIRTIKNPRPRDFLDQAHQMLSARLQGARFSDD